MKGPIDAFPLSKEFYTKMKRFTSLAIGFVFVALFAVSAFAQGGQPAASKIGWIDTQAFAGDEKGLGGVTKYITALKALDTEFKPRATELQNLDNKIRAIAAELETMQKNTAVPVKQETVLAKQEEGQRLQRELEFKQKDAEAALQTRRAAVLGPITADIGKAMQEYAKQKGYSVVLDIAALANANAMIFLDPAAEITNDFITFYNARPAATATTATPK